MMLRLTLRVFVVVFGLGAISNWESSPVAAGMMFMLTLLCFAALIALKFVPPPRRSHMDDEETTKAAREIIDTVIELGTHRVEGSVKLLCPLCQTWCEAKLLTSSTPLSGMTMGTGTGGTIQLHLETELHVHDHECPKGLSVLAGLRSRLEHG